MTQTAPQGPRTSAARVAKWLLDRGQPDEAVRVLTAWAVTGPNDLEGQQLLAEAMRIDPSAPLAREAFERMEGIAPATAGGLDAAIATYTTAELTRLEQEIRKPIFRRAQVGFNNNLKFRGRVFHVQTEDSGLDRPHVITHLFADGGRIIKSHKRSYESIVSAPDVALQVRALMKAQHMEMVLMLREGKFDEVLAGRAVGGVETLTHPPVADVRKLTKRREEGEEAPVSASKLPAGATAAPSQPARIRLTVVRSLTGGPDAYTPRGDEIVLGSSGQVTLPGERFCHPREAVIRFRDGKAWIEDIDGGNGVFLRTRTPVELGFGDELIIGDQLLRIVENPIPDVGPDPGPTYFYSSPTWPSSFRVVQIYEGGQEGACVVARGTTLIVGRTVADLVIDKDPLVDDQHCLVEEQAGVIVLNDLGSRTGTFVRVKGEHELAPGDEILVGRTRLKIELNLR